MKRRELSAPHAALLAAADAERSYYDALCAQTDIAHDAAAFMLWTLAVAKLDDAVRTLGRAAFAEAKRRHAAAQRGAL